MHQLGQLVHELSRHDGGVLIAEPVWRQAVPSKLFVGLISTARFARLRARALAAHSRGAAAFFLEGLLEIVKGLGANNVLGESFGAKRFGRNVLGETFWAKVFFLEPHFASWAGCWAGLGWPGLAGLGWAGLGWALLGCWAAGLLGWRGGGAGLGWKGLGWAGVGWMGWGGVGRLELGCWAAGLLGCWAV